MSHREAFEILDLARDRVLRVLKGDNQVPQSVQYLASSNLASMTSKEAYLLQALSSLSDQESILEERFVRALAFLAIAYSEEVQP